MSTFKGIVAEFPQIRIDYFRPDPSHRAPLACFLSHVHSDHLAGLESLRAPFVYCSAATREILLRLEKFHYRVNFARGILESRNVTYDRSMRKLAKPLPLETPTTIELAPGNNIQVTLIDANHCVGAVMFLIEGDGKAVLYTGDIRAETWWVNSLVQNPILLPYTLGSRRLDCVYLDTTFATKSSPYREFPSKADGIKELLAKVDAYPKDTIFYFHAWTFGYENVWIALSTYLKSRIHLDDYRARIYGSLSNLDKKSLWAAGLEVKSDNKFLHESGLDIREAPALCGFRNGNRIQPGCLTTSAQVRIHSCELGMGCPVMSDEKGADVVHIIPIVTRANGLEIAELGAGGGKGDLDQKEELESLDANNISKILDFFSKSIQDEEVLAKITKVLEEALAKGNSTINLDTNFPREKHEGDNDMSVQNLVSALSAHATKSLESEKPLARSIRFPYSRHSSYSELCYLVEAFRPSDVFPCTVDEANWDPERGMRHLFGPFCSGDNFRHDIEMMKAYEARLEQETYDKQQSQHETQTGSDGLASPIVAKRSIPNDESAPEGGLEPASDSAGYFTPRENIAIRKISHNDDSATSEQSPLPKTSEVDLTPTPSAVPASGSRSEARKRAVSGTSIVDRAPKRKTTSMQQIAYDAALGIDLTWTDLGGLVSARTQTEQESQEL